MSWYTRSWQHMHPTWLRAQAAGITGKDHGKAIEESYPYRTRDGHAYKAWLRARKDFFRLNNIPLRRAKRLRPDLLS